MFKRFPKKILALFVATIWVAACGDFADIPNFVNYQVRYYPAQMPYFEVDLSYRVDSRTDTYLNLPCADTNLPSTCINFSDIRVQSPGTILFQERPDLAKVRKVSGEWVQIRYRISPKATAVPTTELKQDFFQVTGNALFAIPNHFIGEKRFSGNISWKVPATFKVLNSFSAMNSDQDFHTDFFGLSGALFLGGSNLEVYNLSNDGNDLFVAIDGHFHNFDGKQVTQHIANVMHVVREYWNDPIEPYRLVSIRAANQKSIGSGTAHLNAFQMLLANQLTLESPEFSLLIAHEYLHKWIGMEVMRPALHFKKGEFDWFIEGFTDYYAGTILFRAGFVTQDWYLNWFNGELEKYRASSAKLVGLKELSKNYYIADGYFELPYLQGKIIAANWDAAIRKKSSNWLSLDDLMFDLQHTSERGPWMTPERIGAVILEGDYLSKEDFHSDMNKLKFGEALNIREDALGPCFELRETLSFFKSAKLFAPKSRTYSKRSCY